MLSPTTDDDQVLEELLGHLAEKLEKQEFDLPPLPQVALQVLAFTHDLKANAARLTSLIQQDPILTAKIFQTANSAAFGSQRRIESLQHAIAWLGLNHVAGTAFTISVQTGVFNVRGYERQVKGLWTHGIGTGFYAKTIAGFIHQDPDIAFLCGLLHAIGKPYIVHTVNQYRRPTDPQLPWTTMIQLMKESYIEVGRQLAKAWNFPDPVKETINLHQNHAYHLATSPTKGAAITCLARHLTSHLLDPEGIHEDLPVLQYLNITQDNMNALLDIQNSIQAQIETMLI